MSTNTYRVLTGVQPAAIAVVVITGTLVGELLSQRFSRVCRVGRLTHGDLTNAAGELVDDAVVARLSEEAAELSVHGGREVVRAVVEVLRGFGFEEYEVGEPTIEDALPRCRTELAVRVLLAQAALGDREWSTSRGLYWLLHPPRVAVVGLPNVGKSTLVNALAGRGASIVADMEGTTRDYVLAEADVGGLIVELVDTPGVRETGDGIEAGAIELAREVIESAAARVVVLDAAREMVPAERELLARYPDAIVVANRADLSPATWSGALATVATTGGGVSALKGRLLEVFEVRAGMERERLRWWL